MSTFVSLVNDAKKHLEKSTQANPTFSIAIATYLGLAASKLADRNSTIASWDVGSTSLRSTFARQAIPMTWDYCEVNPFEAMGSFEGAIDWIYRLLVGLPSDPPASVSQANAIDIRSGAHVISTDPPYYDNIDYADLSDYFYIWLRKALKDIYPESFATLLVPKADELVATPYRFDGDREKAKQHFERGLSTVFENFIDVSAAQFPVTIYYAFKQIENDDETQRDTTAQEDFASTGWETILESLLSNNWQITGTWPMRTEGPSRAMAQSKNALASSVVLVCRVRDESKGSINRREFLSALKKELAPGLRELQQGSIAPVDLAQAAIGPGMAVFSRHSAVLEADGKPMPVRTALILINQALDEYLTEQEGEYDADTRWALAWFEQFGHSEAPFGVAETLSKAKNTSVNGLEQAGVLEARAGKVRLYRRDELDTDWDPTQDKRLTAWEACQHLIYTLENDGEPSAAELLAKLGSSAEPARDLAYRLYTVCERKGWAQDALGYNSLVVAWPRLKELAARQIGKQQELPL
jgi:putative DNA methylase